MAIAIAAVVSCFTAVEGFVQSLNVSRPHMNEVMLLEQPQGCVGKARTPGQTQFDTNAETIEFEVPHESVEVQ